jgi:hypothetical protein
VERETIAERQDEHELLEAPGERLEEEGRTEALTQEEVEQRSADYFAIVSAMMSAFDGGELASMDAVRRLGDEEIAALEAFERAVRGRVGGRTILAEDRLAALGHALAVLQPTLTMGLDPNAPHALDAFHALVDSVDHLRETLVSLEDAQEELFEQDKVVDEPRPPADDDDEDGDEDEGDQDDVHDAREARPSTLTGAPDEPAVEAPPRKSTLRDDEP